MTDNLLDATRIKLTEIQKRAVDWNEGAMLVLAGPGSGKTQVLTCRIARLLDASREKSFRVLALTFTNKAADEMKERVAGFVPGLEERANIGTFHSFCGQILRQHGVHLNIKPDFAIYSQLDDRKVVLEDALKRAAGEGQPLSVDDVRYLKIIDQLKSLLIGPEEAESKLSRFDDKARIAMTYKAYENDLHQLNVLDFNSLIFEAHRLITKFPAIAARYRRSHPYWLLDEFQDTNDAQYRLIHALAGDEFQNVFAVADDDQIIYQWNGASFRQIQRLRSDFGVELIQLPTNYRCPPSIVEAANKLVSYNAHRTEAKKPLQAGKTKLKFPESEHIQLLVYGSQEEEAEGVALMISRRDRTEWGQTAVLARNRSLLEKIHQALQEKGVQAVIAQRRDDFLSPEFRWLVACLVQTVRPLDNRNITVLIEAFNRIAGIEVSVDQVIADAEATGHGYFGTWLNAAKQIISDDKHSKLLEMAGRLADEPFAAKKMLRDLITEFRATLDGDEPDRDLSQDLKAWTEIGRDIAMHVGGQAPLDQFLQELQLRSKEPTPQPGTVTLMTVHAAKGREFDTVHLIGMAEDILPSYQSRQKGDSSPEMEEERRNCFVAITRAKECLIISRSQEYRGWSKQPSRFLIEMELADTEQ
ncbi:ATP-dependent helicase [Nitratireductor sp. XY-223]|uniref:ATP-dependent helicase n=1 Tax=Nitratireductor sp. XY-223 TaxID=2561926 RepID=UPI0010AA2B34|nr:ATP-dependent helicase [Nitratireductor sp. XY-223]